MVMSYEPMVAQSKGEVRRTWTKTVEAEERTGLVRALLREGIGTADIEAYYGRMCDFLRGGGKGIRRDDRIKGEMRERLRDCEEDEKNWRKKREQARKELEGFVGENSRMYRKFINVTKEEMKEKRSKLKKKNQQKVRHLRSKVIRNIFKLPSCLKRYEDVVAFASDKKIIPEELKGPVTVGIREITLTEGRGSF